MRYAKQRRAMKLAHKIKADHKDFGAALKAAWKQIKEENTTPYDFKNEFLKAYDKVSWDGAADVWQIRTEMKNPKGFDQLSLEMEKQGVVYFEAHSHIASMEDHNLEGCIRDTRGALAFVTKR